MRTKEDKKDHNLSIKDELLTLSEIALYLKVAEKTVLRMIGRGEIPCVRIGGQWRFPYSMIETWVYSKIKKEKNTGLLRLIESDKNIVPLSRLTEEKCIVLGITRGSKKEVLTQLVNPLKQTGIIEESHPLILKLIEREKMASTALGTGVAFPHVRDPEENVNSHPCIIFGVCHEGTDFMALDGEKTYIFCLICIQSIVAHLRVIARLMHIFRMENAVPILRETKTNKAFINELITLENECPRHDSNV